MAVLVAVAGSPIALAAVVSDAPSAALVAAVAVLYAANLACTFLLALALRRSWVAWTLSSTVAPFVVPLALGLLPATSQEPLGFADVAWSRMDDRYNPMVITAIVTLERPMALEALRSLIKARFLRFDRFRQCRVRRAGAYFWVDDPDFDIDRHLEVISLPARCDKDELQRLAGELMSSGLGFSRPLWRVYLVDRYEGGSALIVRFHHCVADGMALVRVLLSLTEEQPSTARSDVEPDAREDAPSEPAPPTEATDAGPAALARPAAWKQSGPSRGLGSAFRAVKDPLRLLYSVARLALLWRDSKTGLRGPMDGVKRSAWSRPIGLETVKAIGRALDAKVNDVVLTALAGALRRYLAGRGEPVERVNVRMMVPVDLRRPRPEIELGNRFGLVFLDLPVGLGEPRAQMSEIVSRMARIKASLEYVATFGILRLLGFVPNAIEQLVNRFFTFKATAVMTNVPGPTKTLYLADNPIRMLMSWVPHAGYLTSGFSILSYSGRVYLGVVTDRRRADDPDAIVAAFEDEIEALVQYADRQPPRVTPPSAPVEQTRAAEASP